MQSRKDQEPEEFKVVDRRLFNSEGELRTDLPPEEATPEAPKPAPTAPPKPSAAPSAQPKEAAAQPAAKSAAERAPAGAETASVGAGTALSGAEHARLDAISETGVQFQHLIMSLVSSAMYQMGMAARPGEMPPPPDLQAARETIDLIGLLAQKTKGNLTHEEDDLLTGSLQELRLAYVELSRHAGRAR